MGAETTQPCSNCQRLQAQLDALQAQFESQHAQLKTLEVAFAQKPLRFEIDYLGQPIWQSDLVTSLTAEKDLAMAYPKEGVDLEYKVAWPPGTPLCAARLSVAANDAELVEKTLWGTGQIDDVLSFP